MATAKTKAYPLSQTGPQRFRIEDYSTLKPSLLWCYEGRVHEANRLCTVAESHLVAWLLLSGGVLVDTHARSGSPPVCLDARTGQWVFAGPASRHQHFTDDASILSISFRLEWPSGDSLMNQSIVISPKDFPGLERTARPLARLVHQHFPGVRAQLWKCGADLGLYFEMQRLFSAWIVEWLKAMLASGVTPQRSPGIDPRIQEALRYLDRHVWSLPFQEKALADETGLGTRQLERLFVQQLGLTPRAYLQKCRLALASTQLSDATLPIKQIAYDLGFSSPSHFCNWFRQATGVSPRRHREQPSLPV